MIVTLHRHAPSSTLPDLHASAAGLGLSARSLTYPDGDVIVIDGALPGDALTLPGIAAVLSRHKPYMLASIEGRQQTVVRLGDVEIGGGSPVMMAGPCVVEGRDELLAAARAVKAAGADVLQRRRLQTAHLPYAFQGLGELGLQHLAAARDHTGLPVVTEVMEPDQVEIVAHYADMLQVGARNMQNYPLLRRVGAAGRPVLLKRGFSATVEEWLMAAEYILAHGNPDVVLCERGIRGFDPAFRFNLDLNAVPHAKDLSHLPVVVDPSHGT
ncbi:MAG: 3-deoxy-7-phosphoheptulonate synthase, partial [Thermomicrobiales bacterium]